MEPNRETEARTAPMENVILIVHLILALALIGVVLLQRSEGGGLGMGGGGGGGGLVSSRGAATAPPGVARNSARLGRCLASSSPAVTWAALVRARAQS